MEGRLLLDIVICEGAAVLKLFAGKDQALLIRRNTFFVLDLLLDVVDGVGRLDFEGDGFTSECFNEDLHASTETKNQMKSGLLLNVVVRQGLAVFQMLAGE